MQTLTVEITNADALKILQDLEEKRFIKILRNPDVNSLVFPGEPLTEEELKRWVEGRESGETMSLKTAKKQWEKQEKQLLALGK
jgi:hypothetical protein